MKALIIVDVQNDFCNGIPGGSTVVKPLNEIIKFAKKNNWIIVASRDWHPENTLTMKNRKAHCIRNSVGAKFHPDLLIDKNVTIISKGEFDLSDKNYSAFNGDNLSLNKFLGDNNVETVYVAGLATDYCVRNTAIDSVKNGFNTYVVWDASRGVYSKKTKLDLKKEFTDNHVKIITSKTITSS